MRTPHLSQPFPAENYQGLLTLSLAGDGLKSAYKMERARVCSALEPAVQQRRQGTCATLVALRFIARRLPTPRLTHCMRQSLPKDTLRGRTIFSTLRTRPPHNSVIFWTPYADSSTLGIISSDLRICVSGAPGGCGANCDGQIQDNRPHLTTTAGTSNAVWAVFAPVAEPET